ncbi:MULTISPECIES: hypothetical protein [Corynebacterium]|uniref:hypothetical protein n=1 Tax=Corynebacterium TaxID=1716 RepID=UPI00254A1B4A|nr:MULTISPECIES: hypothetical protein [Corynebacterium]MDK6260888.1 hypothetical protein [Corynebacterium frankenforstense]MDK8896105.1 hypothetical protein [Corynebacterium sp. MSK006]
MNKTSPSPKSGPATTPARAGGRVPVPATVRYAGIIACVQSVVVIAYAILLLARQVLGERGADIVSEAGGNAGWVATGTAVFLLIVFGGVFAGGLGLARGTHRWGRGPVIILQIIFLPISFSMFGAGAWPLGVVTLVSAVAILVLLFSPASVHWAAAAFDTTGPEQRR